MIKWQRFKFIHRDVRFTFADAYWIAQIIRLSLRWCLNLCLGDKVKHDGQLWILIQGVAAPSWDLVRTDASGVRQRKDMVHEDDFSKLMTPANILWSFGSGYRFYMTSWFVIWRAEGVKDWMRGCRIWSRGKPL